MNYNKNLHSATLTTALHMQKAKAKNAICQKAINKVCEKNYYEVPLVYSENFERQADIERLTDSLRVRQLASMMSKRFYLM